MLIIGAVLFFASVGLAHNNDMVVEGHFEGALPHIHYGLMILPVEEKEGVRYWRGLELAAENRCSEYDKKDYYYTARVEDLIVEGLGGIWSPYDGMCFASIKETDIEHIVATSEGHDSGLCARDKVEKYQFAADLLNLTVSSPVLNRYKKQEKDAADWIPQSNVCWFAYRVLRVKTKYTLTVDLVEAVALEKILRYCSPFIEVQAPEDCLLAE